MNFAEELEKKRVYCEAVLKAYLPCPEDGEGGSQTGRVSHFAGKVTEAMRYSAEAGGKRLRPMFLSETCAMYGGRKELAEPFMAALEMIHTYSLVHDDLPAMDNDDYRRGRLTTHKVYGDGMAVLAGDALLNYAYETAASAFDRAESAEETGRVIRALQLLMRNAGVHGMVGGQCADLEAEKKDKISAEELVYIHEHKTACLIDSGLSIGAILAGAPAADIEKLHTISSCIGLAFQIQDDILDVVGDEKELGKKTGMDAEDNKITYVTMYGLDAAREEVKRLTGKATELYDSLTADNLFLRELLISLVGRTK